MKTQIIPCNDDCPDCKKDIEHYAELIKELSSMHLQQSTDPATLCAASFHEFGKEHRLKFQQLQGELFEIASRHELSWTET